MCSDVLLPRDPGCPSRPVLSVHVYGVGGETAHPIITKRAGSSLSLQQQP